MLAHFVWKLIYAIDSGFNLMDAVEMPIPFGSISGGCFLIALD
jgi:hypothetical protein